MSLFDDFKINGTYFKNRVLVVLPVKDRAQKNGKISISIRDDIIKLVKRGVGTIILDNVFVSKHGKSHSLQLGIDEEHIIRFKRLINYTKDEGVVLGIRLSHSGAKTNEDICGEQPISASSIHFGKDYSLSRPFGYDDMEEIAINFKHAAEQAVESGFEIIELNGGEQELFEQCFNPKFNSREDKYGGTLPNRLRLIVNIIKGIKTRIDNKLLSYCFPVYDKQDSPLTGSSLQKTISHLENAGIDIFHPVAVQVLNTIFEKHKTVLHWTKEATKKKIIATGNIKSVGILNDAIKFNIASLYNINSNIHSRPNWYYLLQKRLER